MFHDNRVLKVIQDTTMMFLGHLTTPETCDALKDAITTACLEKNLAFSPSSVRFENEKARTLFITANGKEHAFYVFSDVPYVMPIIT